MAVSCRFPALQTQAQDSPILERSVRTVWRKHSRTAWNPRQHPQHQHQQRQGVPPPEPFEISLANRYEVDGFQGEQPN